jgi:hypothetical protein
MSQPIPPKPSPVLTILPWFVVLVLAGMSYFFHAKYLEANAYTVDAQETVKINYTSLNKIANDAEAKTAEVTAQLEGLKKQLADAEATAATWREQFNTLGASRQGQAQNPEPAPPGN